jgi:hypothetical protein
VPSPGSVASPNFSVHFSNVLLAEDVILAAQPGVYQNGFNGRIDLFPFIQAGLTGGNSE